MTDQLETKAEAPWLKQTVGPKPDGALMLRRADDGPLVMFKSKRVDGELWGSIVMGESNFAYAARVIIKGNSVEAEFHHPDHDKWEHYDAFSTDMEADARAILRHTMHIIATGEVDYDPDYDTRRDLLSAFDEAVEAILETDEEDD